MIGVGISPVLAAVYGDGEEDVFALQDILERFPRLGSSRSDWWDGIGSEDAPGQQILHESRPDYLIYLGAGNSGVVRGIWGASMHLPTWGSLNDYELRIYTDAGDIENVLAPPAEHLTATIALGPLLGAVYDTARGACTFSTPILDYFNGGTAQQSDGFALNLRLPIPFANGILIQVWKRTGIPAVDPSLFGDYHWVTYELGLSSWAGMQYRLKAASVHGIHVASQDEAVVLNTNGKDGLLVGVFASASASIVVEGNWRGYADGESVAGWQTSGYEDLFGVNPYAFSGGEQQGPYAGVTHIGETGIEAYRLFLRDPIHWMTGFKLAHQRDQNEGGEWDLSAVALYYEKV